MSKWWGAELRVAGVMAAPLGVGGGRAVLTVPIVVGGFCFLDTIVSFYARVCEQVVGRLQFRQCFLLRCVAWPRRAMVIRKWAILWAGRYGVLSSYVETLDVFAPGGGRGARDGGQVGGGRPRGNVVFVFEMRVTICEFLYIENSYCTMVTLGGTPGWRESRERFQGESFPRRIPTVRGTPTNRSTSRKLRCSTACACPSKPPAALAARCLARVCDTRIQRAAAP
jgi:hypothetical protein